MKFFATHSVNGCYLHSSFKMLFQVPPGSKSGQKVDTGKTNHRLDIYNKLSCCNFMLILTNTLKNEFVDASLSVGLLRKIDQTLLAAAKK